MTKDKLVAGFVVVLASLGGIQRAQALPADKTIQYQLHETPTDPNSDVIWVVVLKLEADDSDANSVGWTIKAIRIRDETASPNRAVWIEQYPTVDSGDGLWWVDHADTESPQYDEFVLPPALEGTVIAQTSGYEDMDYDVEGLVYVEPPGGPPYEITSALDYTFDGEANGNDEPVETPDGPNDPSWVQ